MRLALVAEESAGIQAIRMIAADPDHDLVVVFTRAPSGPTTGDGRRRRSNGSWPDVRSAIEVRTEGRAGLLRRLRVDVLLNVHGLNLVHPAVLAAPSIGSFNLASRTSPEAYAGLNAPSWGAFLNGEDHHAVTLHWMVAELDAGPVAYTTSFPLGADATGLSASLDCVRYGMPLIPMFCHGPQSWCSSRDTRRPAGPHCASPAIRTRRPLRGDDPVARAGEPNRLARPGV